MNRGYAIADSGYWFALSMEQDQYHRAAVDTKQNLKIRQIQVLKPLPTMFEVFNTKFVKRYQMMPEWFKTELQDPKGFLSTDWQEPDLHLELAAPVQLQRNKLSLVDFALREALGRLAKEYYPLKYLITTNPGDFMAATQRTRGLEIINLKEL